MGGPNLEVFKFGMYIMFPIGFMYYFGINLDSRFSVPDFWPQRGQTHQIPFDRDEIRAEVERLKQRRLAARARRLAMEEEEAEEAAAQRRHPADLPPREGPKNTTPARREPEPEPEPEAAARGEGAATTKTAWWRWRK